MKIRFINLNLYMKSKLVFSVLGVFVGALFSLCEAIVSYGDTASPGESVKEMFFNTISNTLGFRGEALASIAAVA